MRRLVAASLSLLIPALTASAQTPVVVTDTCTIGPYVIDFVPRSTAMKPPAQTIIANSVANDACLGNSGPMEIEGFIANGEPRALALRRAAIVRQRLIALGVPRRRIHIAAPRGGPGLAETSRHAVVTITWAPLGAR